MKLMKKLLEHKKKVVLTINSFTVSSLIFAICGLFHSDPNVGILMTSAGCALAVFNFSVKIYFNQIKKDNWFPLELKYKIKQYVGDLCKATCFASLAFLVAYSIVVLLCITFIDSSTVFIDEDGKSAFSTSNRMMFWDDNPLLSSTKRFSYRSKLIEVKFAGPHAVTANPKVRNIAYEIKIAKYGSIENFLTHQKTIQPYRASTENWIKFLLYEFNEDKSKELSRFYNPNDEKQQKEFFELLEEFLKPHLNEAAVKLINASFYIPQNI